VTVPTILDTGAANPYYGSVPQTYTPPLAAPMGPSGETLPTPRPIDTFRYDGGPAVPVPMPDGARPMPMTQPGSPLNTAAVNRVKASPAKKITYPAYGEELPPPRPATTNPILVKKPGQK
jgi:hypothetical protein